MNKFKKFARTALKGLARMVGGVANAVVYAASVYGFISTPAESGYGAVLTFMASAVALAVAVGLSFVLGFVESHK